MLGDDVTGVRLREDRGVVVADWTAGARPAAAALRVERGVVAADGGVLRGGGVRRGGGGDAAALTSGRGSRSGRRDDDSGTSAYESLTGGAPRSTDLRRRLRPLQAMPHPAASITTTRTTPAPTPSDSISDALFTNVRPLWSPSASGCAE